MIKFKCDEGRVELSVRGDMTDIQADICMMIYQIHNGLCERNDASAEMFRDFVKNFLPKIFDKDALDELINNEKEEFKEKEDRLYSLKESLQTLDEITKDFMGKIDELISKRKE